MGALLPPQRAGFRAKRPLSSDKNKQYEKHSPGADDAMPPVVGLVYGCFVPLGYDDANQTQSCKIFTEPIKRDIRMEICTSKRGYVGSTRVYGQYLVDEHRKCSRKIGGVA